MIDADLFIELASTRSGSAGDLVASHNQHGQYLRDRTIPFDPLTPRQAALRLDFAFIGARWSNNLTDLDRQSWHTYARNVPLINRLGDPRHLNGQNHWLRSGVPRSHVGLSTAFQAPTLFNLGDFTLPTYRAVSALQTLQLTFDNRDDWANETGSAMIVYGSRPQPNTVNFFKGPYRLVSSILGNSTVPPSSPTGFLYPFPFARRDRLFLRVNVTRIDNRLSPSFRDSADA